MLRFGGAFLAALIEDGVVDEPLRVDDVARVGLAVLGAGVGGGLGDAAAGDDGIALPHVDATHGVGRVAEELHGRLDGSARVVRPAAVRGPHAAVLVDHRLEFGGQDGAVLHGLLWQVVGVGAEIAPYRQHRLRHVSSFRHRGWGATAFVASHMQCCGLRGGGTVHRVYKFPFSVSAWSRRMRAGRRADPCPRGPCVRGRLPTAVPPSIPRRIRR